LPSEKEEINLWINDICLSIFRGKGLEYTGEKRIFFRWPSLFQVIFFFSFTLFFLFLVLPYLGPFSQLMTIFLFIYFLRKTMRPEVIIDISESFSLREELLVTEFQLSQPELTFSEIQVLKKIRLSLLNEDFEFFLESLSECQLYPNLRNWNLIKWIFSRIVIEEIIVITRG